MATGPKPTDKNLTFEQEAARQSWQYRAVQMTRGNQTKMGALVLAVIGKMPDNPPRITGSATITVDGFVLADFHSRNNGHKPGALICDVDTLQRGFSRLADALKLNDHDRIDMFAAVKKWIFKDYRADTMLNFTQER